VELLALIGAAAAWLGVTLQSAATERRGGALGLAVAGLGLALATAAGGKDPVSSAAIAAGGVLAALLQLRGGDSSSSGLLPPGSTPRLIAAIAVLAAVGLVGASSLGTPAGIPRLAGVVVAVVAGGQVLTTDRSWVALSGGSAIALGLGALGDGLVTVVAAVVAVVLAAIEPDRPVARTGE
jgi:hypothetical protein